MTVELLPDSAWTLERATLHAMLQDLAVPFSEIVDPARAPLEWLPFLAVHRGVRFWYADWPEARKRDVISKWYELAALIGTRAAAERFLGLVDTTIVHKVSYPAQKPIGRWALGLSPIDHPPFTSRFLVKTELRAPKGAFIIGRTAIGRGSLSPPSVEPLRRAKAALTISKAPETAYAVSFAHRVRRTLRDGFDLRAGHALGSFKDRVRL